MIKLNLKPAPHILRQFAWIAAVLLPLLAAFLTRGEVRWHAVGAWQWSHPVVLAVGGLGVAQLLLFLAGVRQLTALLYAALSLIAFPIGLVLSHVLMAAIYYLVITPIGLLFRLMGRDVLGRRLDKGCSTYWHERGAPRDTASYFKLY